MLTEERVATLTAVHAGTVTARRANAPGSPILYDPPENTVSLGFLYKAGLAEVTVNTYRKNGTTKHECTVSLTPKGERAYAYATSNPA